MERNIYLQAGNAEEILPDVISLIKSKTASDSRVRAFDDCTKYWKERVESVFNSELSDSEKLEAIQKMF